MGGLKKASEFDRKRALACIELYYTYDDIKLILKNNGKVITVRQMRDLPNEGFDRFSSMSEALCEFMENEEDLRYGDDEEDDEIN